jgi:hypothetical protein
VVDKTPRLGAVVARGRSLYDKTQELSPGNDAQRALQAQPLSIALKPPFTLN